MELELRQYKKDSIQSNNISTGISKLESFLTEKSESRSYIVFALGDVDLLILHKQPI